MLPFYQVSWISTFSSTLSFQKSQSLFLILHHRQHVHVGIQWLMSAKYSPVPRHRHDPKPSIFLSIKSFEISVHLLTLNLPSFIWLKFTALLQHVCALVKIHPFCSPVWVLGSLVNFNTLEVWLQFYFIQLSLEAGVGKKSCCTAVLSESNYLATVKIQPKPQRCLKLHMKAYSKIMLTFPLSYTQLVISAQIQWGDHLESEEKCCDSLKFLNIFPCIIQNVTNAELEPKH